MIFLYLIFIPLLGVIFLYISRRLRNEFSFLGSILTLYFAITLFLKTAKAKIVYEFGTVAGLPIVFRADALSGFFILFASIFSLLVIVYSFKGVEALKERDRFFAFALLILGVTNCIFLSSNFAMLFFFWALLLFLIYKFFLTWERNDSSVAKTALVIMGLSDVLLFLGIIILVYKDSIFTLAPSSKILLRTPLMIMAFLFCAAGAFGKLGLYPFHRWIPQVSSTAPVSVMAYIPASLGRLVGAYLYVRIAYFIFDISSNFWLQMIFLLAGTFGILLAVVKAMLQNETQKVLAYAIISQAGYMILGISTGIPIGVAGGVFHTINNALHQTALLLTTGALLYRTKTTQLDKMGGIAEKMPITFICFLIAGLSIAGVPPLNGFFSQWLIYQSFIELAQTNFIYMIFPILGMFGNILTIGVFFKLTHSLFLGRWPKNLDEVKEVPFSMRIPAVILALFCCLFGIFAYRFPLKVFILPGLEISHLSIHGYWNPSIATGLFSLGIGIGFFFYVLGKTHKFKKRKIFIGGEDIDVDHGNFYSGIYEIEIFRKIQSNFKKVFKKK